MDLDSKLVEGLASELNNKYGIDSAGYTVGITKESEIKQNCKDILERYEHSDALVNNTANKPKVDDQNDFFSPGKLFNEKLV